MCVGEVSVYVFAMGEIERVVGMCMRSCVSTAVIRMTMRMSRVPLHFCAWKVLHNAKKIQ